VIRVIATLLWNGQTLVKGVGFDAWRSVGQPLQAINVFQMREVDEILFLDITATKEGRRPNFPLIEQLSEKCFVPLTVGGGVQSVEDVYDLLRAGADKVCMYSALSQSLVRDVAMRFGAQVLVACLQITFPHEGFNTRYPVDAPTAWGAGEMLLQYVPQDGTLAGYPMVPIEMAAAMNTIPIIASGGAGTYEHFAQAIDAGASAVAAGAMWLFTEQTPLEAKQYLKARGYDVRL